MLTDYAPTLLALDSNMELLHFSTETAETITVEECRRGGGEVELNPGGYPRHCKGGVHDGKPLAY